MKYVKFYRVQGGNGFSKSREMLNVSNSNKLELDLRKKIHIGGEQHNKNFIDLRLGEKWQRYAGLDLNNESVNVVVMYFPEFFAELLRQCAIPEYQNTGKDVLAPPHSVDISKGEAYAMYGAWNGIMKACCMYAKDNVVSTPEQAQTLYEDDEQITQKFHPIDMVMLENFLNHAKEKAKITPYQITEILEEAKIINEEIKLRGENIK